MSPLTRVLSLCPTSSGLLVRPSTCASTSLLDIILRVMARLSSSTSHSNSISSVTATISRTTGQNYYHSQSLHTTMHPVQLLEFPPSLQIKDIILTSLSTQNAK